MNISLQTNDHHKLELRDIHKSGRDYSCRLIVKSRGFSASVVPFYFDEHYLTTFVENLNLMDSKLEGEATLGYSFEEDKISLKVVSSGHVIVSGFLVERSEYLQQLEFWFETDQTVLKPLLQEFRKLKSASGAKP